MTRSFVLTAAILCAVTPALSQEPARGWRTWEDDTGMFTVQAVFVSSAGGRVTLRRTDGQLVTFALNKLSAFDQTFAARSAPMPVGPAFRMRQPLPAKVTDAWKAAGFDVGWSGKHSYGEFTFRSRDVDENPAFLDDETLPGLASRKSQAGVIGKLPIPGAPFALHFIDAGVFDADLQEITRIATIEMLHFHGAKITDAGIKQLTALQRLKKLSLFKCREITDDGIKELEALPQLELLHLELTPTTNACLKDVARFKALKKLSVAFTKVSDAGVPDLVPLVGLVELNLSHNHGITDAGLKPLTAFKSLTALRLNDTSVTDAGMKDVAAIRSLELLEIASNPITDEGLQELAALKSLRFLFIGDNRVKVTKEGIKALQEALPHLVIEQ